VALTDTRRPGAAGGARPNAPAAAGPRAGSSLAGPARTPRRTATPRWVRSVLFLAALLAAFAGMHVVVKDQSWWFV
jgi:type VI protein secretion system component VasF